MMPVSFTVVSTCLNQARFIERTICSVLDQGWDRLQYIVVDRGSADDSGDVIGLYADELTRLTEPGAGRAEAINTAVRHATGDIVVIVDDVLPAGALHEAAKLMSGAGAAGWLVGQCLRIDEDDFELGVHSAMAPPTLAAFLMHDAGMLPLASTFIRRELLQQHGPFDTSLVHAFDYEYWCRLMVGGLRPKLSLRPLGIRRELAQSDPAALTLRRGLEYIATARRYARRLPLRQQVALWRNCDRRQRIYALAEAETQPAIARRHMWRQLMRHPWWIADESVRHTLLRGVQHPAPAEPTRHAA